tara:strand:+ start:1033 stop:1386 length:354 start_codon:yes stop_codon:yes gene_type:complete
VRAAIQKYQVREIAKVSLCSAIRSIVTVPKAVGRVIVKEGVERRARIAVHARMSCLVLFNLTGCIIFQMLGADRPRSATFIQSSIDPIAILFQSISISQFEDLVICAMFIPARRGLF